MTFRTRALITGSRTALRRIFVIGASIGLLAVPATAAAGTSPGGQSSASVPAPAGAQSPDNFSAGDQYVETLPSTRGPAAADGKHHKSVKLPAAVEQKLHGGPDAAKLVQIATSTELGAPDQKLGKGGRRDRQSQTGVPSAAIDAVGGGHASLGLLAIWLLVITALALGTVGYRRYKNRNASD